jgi:hypothetical protein
MGLHEDINHGIEDDGDECVCVLVMEKENKRDNENAFI